MHASPQKGLTARDYAVKKSHREIVAMIDSYNASFFAL